MTALEQLTQASASAAENKLPLSAFLAIEAGIRRLEELEKMSEGIADHEHLLTRARYLQISYEGTAEIVQQVNPGLASIMKDDISRFSQF